MLTNGLNGLRVKSLLLAALCLCLLLMIGCGHQEAPSAPGYYTGPMKGKTAASTGNRGGNPQRSSYSSTTSQGS